MTEEKDTAKKGPGVFKMGLGIFVLVTLASLMSIRSFPTMGLVAWQLIAFSILAIVMYLIPASLISAELATGWPKTGGVYIWVREAFGKRWGFTAVWMQWFQMTIGFIGILTFIAATVSYVIDSSLADDKLFQFLMVVVVWWGMTIVNFKGLKTYARVNSLFVSIGVLIPGAILILGGIWWVMSGHTTLVTLNPTLSDFIPNFANIDTLVLLVTFIFIFIGIEMTSVHAKEIKNVGRNYPLGLLMVGLIMTGISILGALVISMMVPVGNLNLLAGIMQSYQIIFGAGIAVTILALMITIGSIGEVSAWILGPVRGLLVTAQDGNLPTILQKENKNGMPVNMMILQAILITFWGGIYVILPGGVNSSYWMLFALATLVYIVMYFLMYAAAIKLRYSHPEVKRAFTVPGGKLGMWLLAGWGFASMAFLFILALVPPSQITSLNLSSSAYILLMLFGIIVITIVPLVIYHFKKPSWTPEKGSEGEKEALE